MSEIEESKQRPEVEETKRQQDEEKIRNEGGPRLNGRLAATAVGLMVGLVILLTLAVQSSGPGAQPSGRNGTDDTASNKSEVQDLIAHAGDPTPAAFPAPPTDPPAMVIPREQTSAPAVPRQPNRYAEWAQDKYMKALEAPEMVSAFHSGAALQIPSMTQTGNGDAGNTLAMNSFQSSSDSSSSVRLHPPASLYTVMTGSVIPAVLISGINSDLPGPIVAQVSQNVYDSAGGRSLLIPQGSRLIGSYRSAAGYGQSRVQIQWQRLIFPNTASMDIPQMPGTDEAGYAGFTDQVNNHYMRTFGTAALMSLISAGQAVGQMAAFGGGMGGPLGYYQPNQWAMASQMAGSSASSQFGSVGQQAIEQGMNSGPTLEIRPGYQFNVMVTEDLVFPGPYKG
jgi:type IV secretory pathway VirB10-like protein